ncbi:MAG: PA2779 family protein [Xanthomonadales bacterium]|nr:PA2779 family protein [Xanthomonadales bacterium]
MSTTQITPGVVSKALSLVLFLVLAAPAQAEMIGTDEAIAAESRLADSATVMQFLTREDVADRMEALGVEPDLAQERVAMLSDEEVRHLAERIESDPAGADVIGVLGVTFLVLLVLEFVGVIDIFS